MIKSTSELSKKDFNILLNNFVEVDEELIDTRKGIAQTRYIICLKNTTYYCHKDDVEKQTPEYLKGFWIQRYAEDNSYEDPEDRLKHGYEFVKCKPVEVTVTKYEEI